MTDIATGDTTGRDQLREDLGADGHTDITDAMIQRCWDVAVDATYRYIREPYRTDAPAGVVAFVSQVGCAVWRMFDSGGDLNQLPDGTITTGPSLATAIMKARHLAGPYIVTPRVVA